MSDFCKVTVFTMGHNFFLVFYIAHIDACGAQGAS